MAASMITDNTALQTALRHDRLIVVASLAGVAALAWAYLVVLAKAMAAMGKPSGWGAFMGLMPMGGRWGFLEYALAFTMWALMMVGMMIPSAAPMIVLYARVVRRALTQNQPLASTSAFVAGYFLVWSAFSLVAAVIQGQLVELALVTNVMTSASAVLSGAVLIAAGLYQWTPLKHACLAHCRSPIHVLSQHWQWGMSGALRMGIDHGAYCVGCCWVLMAVLFAVGIMNLAWVAAIAAIVLIEKVAPFERWTRRIAGALLVALGVATLAGSSVS
jgi:predicted metal-binding membrane protein